MSAADGNAKRPRPEDLLVDTVSDYALHKPTGQAWTIDFVPEEFAEGLGGIKGFVAVAVPLRSNPESMPPREVAHHGRRALEVYLQLLKRRLHDEAASQRPKSGEEKPL